MNRRADGDTPRISARKPRATAAFSGQRTPEHRSETGRDAPLALEVFGVGEAGEAGLQLPGEAVGVVDQVGKRVSELLGLFAALRHEGHRPGRRLAARRIGSHGQRRAPVPGTSLPARKPYRSWSSRLRSSVAAT